MSLSNNFPAVRPSLLLDFARSKVLDPRITFTRASTGTYYDEDGILQTAQNNVARFDHNPATEESLGLLIEEQRTNLFKYSSDYSNAAWAKRAGTGVLGAQTTAPDGTLTGFSIFDSASSTGTYIRQAATGWPDNTIVTVSVYVKKQQLTSVRLTSYAKDSVNNNVQTTINFDTGVITSSTGGTIANASGGGVFVGNGWWRIFTTFNSSSGANDIPINLGTAGISPVGDGTSSFYAWGAQLEVGTFASSYIATVASQVTRLADAASMTGTNFSSWFNAGEGTVYFESQTAQGTNSYPYSLFGTNTQNRIFANYTTTQRIESGVRINNIFEAGAVSPNNSAPINTFGKGATAYKVNDFGFSWNGAAALTDTSTTLPIVLKLDIGNNGGLAGNWLNGTISKIAYYPFRLPNNQLQALTGS